MNDALIWGLFAADDRPVPLEGVRIDARVADLATEVTVAQRYRNREQTPVEAVYVFPLEEGAAVCGFEARIGDKVVRGRVEEREQAFEIYDDAMADGHGAFLLDQERPNVFTASVGNLRPQETVEIRITYVALASYVTLEGGQRNTAGSAIRLMIPTTVSPRYVPPVTEPEIGQPDGERVNPDRWFEVPYGLELAVEVEANAQIQSIESPSHPVRVENREQGATVSLAQEQAALDRDFVLLIETAELHQPCARVAREEDGTHVCQVTFHPQLEARDAGSEVLFLLDCSGSMIGDSIDQARRALALSIRALEEGDTFNVVRFGSRFESLWRRPKAFDERRLEAATEYIEKAEADLGGTEILGPLRKLLELRRDPERRRQILLLTDGEVGNEKEIVKLAEQHADRARIFTFGIGAGSSEYLVRELARVSRGASEFIFPGERIEPKVLRMFGRVRSPALDDVRLDWGGLEVEQAPARVPPIFAGDSLTAFGRVRGGTGNAVTLSAGGSSWQLDVDLEAAEEGGAVPALWAREMLRDLERGVTRGSRQQRRAAEERRHRRMVELGRRYGLTSSATSYVAIEERTEDKRTTEPAELRKIPVALTVGWGGQGRRLTPRRRIKTGAARPGAPHGGFQDAVVLSAPVAAAPAPAAALAEGNLFQTLAGLAGDAGKSIRQSVNELVMSGLNELREQKQRDKEQSVGRSAARPPADRLYALLMTQKANGSFHLSPILEDWLGSDLAAVESAAAEHGEAEVATAVAVALLERDMASRSGEWQPAARKARKWLESQGADFDAEALLAKPVTVS